MKIKPMNYNIEIKTEFIWMGACLSQLQSRQFKIFFIILNVFKVTWWSLISILLGTLILF